MRFWHIAVCLLVALIVAFVVFRFAAHTIVGRRVDAIRAAGYPVTLSELDAWYTIPPFAQNAADAITEAFAWLKIPSGEAREKLPLFGKTELPPRGAGLDANTVALIDDSLQENESTLKLIRQGVAIRHCRYPLDFTRGFALLMPHVSHLRNATTLLSLEALRYAEQGDSERATDALTTALKLADSVAQEPLLISQLVRLACQSRATSTLEFLLNRELFREEQLLQLDRTLAAGYDPNAMTRALVGERCLGHAAFADPKEANLSTGTPGTILVACERAAGLHDQGWAIYLDLMDGYIRASKLPPWERQKAADAVVTEAQAVPKFYVMLHVLMPKFAHVIQTATTHLARIQTTRAALAVERYRLDKSDLPARLSDLVPTYLSEIPLDPFDGKPLRYQRREKGYIVYSIGQDRQDDGGTERPRRGARNADYDITSIVER